MPFTVEYGVPVRFVALEWSEDWKCDHPSVLLEPFVRYSSHGLSCEEMIDDAVCDVAVDCDSGRPIDDEDVSQEFTWRNWSLDELRHIANRLMLGKRDNSGKNFRVLAETFVFSKRNGETIFVSAEAA